MAAANHHIRLVPKEAIDTHLWDQLLQDADNASLYATRAYLNLFTANWCALVYNNYEAVMPIPFKKKWGIQYTYTPVGMAQLGIIGNKVTPTLEQFFIQSLHQYFRYGTLLFNASFSAKNIATYQMQVKDNYVLSLADTYENLYNNFTKDAKKNLRRAAAAMPVVSDKVAASSILQAFMQQYQDRGNIAALHTGYQKFSEGLEALCMQHMAFKVAILDNDEELLAAGVFGTFKNRIYYIFGAPTPAGKQYNATHVLIDTVIKRFAGTLAILDFEGSSIPSVAQFYKKFSPVNEPYPSYHFNKLPALIRWLKR